MNGYRGFVRYANGSEIEIQPLSTRDEYNGTRASAVNNEDVVARRSSRGSQLGLVGLKRRDDPVLRVHMTFLLR